VGVLDQGGQVLGLRGVDDVEEELTVWQAAWVFCSGKNLARLGCAITSLMRVTTLSSS